MDRNKQILLLAVCKFNYVCVGYTSEQADISGPQPPSPVLKRTATAQPCIKEDDNRPALY